MKKRSDLFVVEVTVSGRVVKQLCVAEDWSFATATPVNGESEFQVRHVRPICTLGGGVLGALVEDLLERPATDAEAVRTLGMHVRGLYLNPDTVLNHRALTTRDIGNALHVKTLGDRTTSVAKFDALVQSWATRIEVDADVDRELVSTLTKLPYASAVAQKPAPALLRSVAVKHNALYAELRRNASNLARAVRTPTPYERDQRHRIRQMLLDRLPDDKLASRVAAFRYSCAGDDLVERANGIILDALRAQSKLSAAEARLFEQLYLRWRPVNDCPLIFNGIFGHRPFLLSTLQFSPSTAAHLILARCWDLPDGVRAAIEQDFQIQLVAALRAATEVIDSSREVETSKRRRSRQRAIKETSRSRLHWKAAEVLANPRNATPHQLEACRHLVESASLTDAARALDVPYQVVQNAVNRGWARVTGRETRVASPNTAARRPAGAAELSARPPIGGRHAQYISRAVIRRRPPPSDLAPMGEHRNARAAP